MSTNSTKTNESGEVDFSIVSKGINQLVGRVNSFFYRCVRFVVRNAIIIGILFVLGVGIGIWMDNAQKDTYNTRIIVQPNFGSVDYLYSKIDLLQSKIENNDTLFFKKIGIKNPKDLNKIGVKPINDIFRFIGSSNTDQNYKLIELMAQDGDIKKIATDNATSKNYPFHVITFTTKGKTSDDKTVGPLLAYLNDNAYFKKVQQQYLENVKIKIQANDTMIAQIDGLLKEFSNESGARSQSVYINENTQLNDVLKTKDELVKEQGRYRVEIVGLDKIIKDNSTISNIMDNSALNGKMKLILPIFFLGLFLCIYLFRAFYRKQKTKHETK